jgi:hypothetical protein
MSKVNSTSNNYPLPEEIESTLKKIRQARNSGAEYFSTAHDFPSGVHKLDLKARKDSEVRQFKHIHQNCFMLAGDLLTACQLRLLLLLDGYLVLADTRNGLPLFGITRSIMELNGLLMLLEGRLSRFRHGDKSDWKTRGEGFFSYLVRAREGLQNPVSPRLVPGLTEGQDTSHGTDQPRL